MSWKDTGYGRPGYRSESRYRQRTDEKDRAEGERRRRIEEIQEARQLKQSLSDPWEAHAGARAPMATPSEGQGRA